MKPLEWKPKKLWQIHCWWGEALAEPRGNGIPQLGWSFCLGLPFRATKSFPAHSFPVGSRFARCTMTTDAPAARSARSWPAALLLFAGSGCAAWIYVTAWLQWLPLVIGASPVSRAILSGVLLGGWALGALVLPRLISPRFHPWRVYAATELGVGIFGLLAFLLLPALSRFYTTHSGAGSANLWLRALVCAVVALPAALVSGAAFPAFARWSAPSSRESGNFGFLLAAYLAGAATGVLVTVFYLLPQWEMAATVGVAVGLNGLLALVAFGLSFKFPRETRPAAAPATPARKPSGSGLIYFVTTLSGSCALAAGVVWFRFLRLMLGDTVYTHAIIKSVFIAGLGLGAGAGVFWARRSGRPRFALGWCHALLTVAVAWAAWMLCASLPFWPVDSKIVTGLVFKFQLDAVRAVWALFPAAFLWGAGLSLALASGEREGRDSARAAGGILGCAALGAVLGLAGCDVCLLTRIGTRQTQQIVVGLSCLAAVLMFATSRRKAPVRQNPARAPRNWAGIARWLGGLAVTILIGGLTARTLPFVPWNLVAYGRAAGDNRGRGTPLYAGEGASESVAVTQSGQFRVLHVNGRAVSSTDLRDLRFHRMLAQIPALLHPYPRTALVAGCGAGVTAGALTSHASLSRVVVCEMDPLVPRVAARFFSRQNGDVLNDPRTAIVGEDPRHYMRVSPEKFDLIISDPGPPWVEGMAGAYTKEYFERCKVRLQPGGFVAWRAPLLETGIDEVKCEIATFLEVFPNATLWSNDLLGETSDLVVVGAVDPLKINVDEIQQRIDRNPVLTQSLRESGILSAVALLGTYAGEGPDLGLWLLEAGINREPGLNLQFTAGLALDANEGGAVHRELSGYLRFPEELFNGSASRRQSLRQLVKNSNARK